MYIFKFIMIHTVQLIFLLEYKTYLVSVSSPQYDAICENHCCESSFVSNRLFSYSLFLITNYIRHRNNRNIIKFELQHKIKLYIILG